MSEPYRSPSIEARREESAKQPYEKPGVSQAQIRQLLEVCFATEGNVYRRFNDLADKLEDVQRELLNLSQLLDKVSVDIQKVDFAVEVWNKELERLEKGAKP